MKSVKFVAITLLLLALTGCGAKTLEYQNESDALGEADINDVLIRVDPEFAKKNQPSALTTHYNADTSTPLRTQPKSAELIIAPHITKDGVYHNYTAMWIVVEEGDWAIGTSAKKKRVGGNKIVVQPLKK